MTKINQQANRLTEQKAIKETQQQSAAQGQKAMNEPFFEMVLPLPPSVNGYWTKKVHKKFGQKKSTVHVELSDKARKFRANVIAQVAQLGRISTYKGRVKAELIVSARDKGKIDLDNFCKGTFDALTHARVWGDDSQVDELVVKRGEIVKGGQVIVKLWGID